MYDLRLLVTMFSLDSCVSCRACSESCPSYRNGGIDPELTVSDVIEHKDPEDLWKCLQCHRCTIICPQEIDVAGMMLALRETESRKGNIPEKIRKTSELFAKDGYVSLPKGRMGSLRKELGLSDVTANEDSVRELNIILGSTGFFHE